MTYDFINPDHYRGGRQFEPIAVIEDWGLNYHLGSALKYISRNGRKPGEDPREGLRKAVWYLERLIEKYTEEIEQAADADEVIEKMFFDSLEQEERDFEALGDKARINDIPTSVIPGSDRDGPFIPASEFVPFDANDERLDELMKEIYAAEDEFYRMEAVKKDLSQFEGKEIVRTSHIEGSILGHQRNGDVIVLGRDRLYEQSKLYKEIQKADPQDLWDQDHAPSELEFNWDDYDFDR